MLNVTHKFVSVKADDPDATLINPSNWNDTHLITDNSGDALASDFDFTAQAPSVNLLAGVAASITLTPVPKGVNASDSKHNLRITGTGGSSETVLIIGGTAVSEAASGTILFTPANDHVSGSWSIGSATAGIAEAQQYLITNFNAGTVRVGPGVHTVTGTTNYQRNMTFAGSGPSTVIKVTANMVIFDANVPTKPDTEYTLLNDNITFKDFTVSGTEVAGVNSIYGIRGIVTTGSTEVWGYYGIRILRIDFDNVTNAILFHRVRQIDIIGCGLWCNSAIFFADSSLANSTAHISSDIVIDRLRYAWHSMNATSTLAAITTGVLNFTNSETVKITNCFFGLPGAVNNTGAATGISIAGGEDYIIHNCTFLNGYASIILGGFTYSGTTYWAGFVTISHCSMDQIWGPAIWLIPGSSTAVGHQVGHVQIIGNQITDLFTTQASANFLLVGAYSKQIIISDNIFRNLLGSINQVGMIIDSNVTELIFGTNIWDNETGNIVGTIGININASALNIYGLERNLFNSAVFGTTISDGRLPVASAAALAIPVGRRNVTVSGTTTITSMTYTGQIGDEVTLLFSGALQVTKGNNIKINANFTSSGTAVGALSLYWDGTNMIEKSRSAN